MSLQNAKLATVRDLLRAGQRSQALAACQRVVQAAPKDPAANSMMAEVLLANAQPARALHFAATASALAPADLGLLMQWGMVLSVADKLDKALEVYTKAAALAPNHPGPPAAMAGILMEQNQFTKAERLCRRAVELAPADAGKVSQHAGALLNLGRAEEAAAQLRALAATYPQDAPVAGGLALVLNYVPGVLPAELANAHRRYGELLQHQQPVPARTFANIFDPAKRIRVGILSPDLRGHSVAWFIEPLLEHHNRAEIEIVVYQTNHIADAVTQRLKKLVPLWRVMDTSTDDQLAAAILADKVDILIELSGLTQGHSLPALHARAAPLQATYLGYPNTTGVPAVDLRFVDSHTDPAGVADAFATERLVRLDPCFLCYKPPVAPPPSPLPCETSPVTFGSFNNSQKINGRVVALWAKVLEAVPGSRLVLKSIAFADDELRADIERRFTDRGVPASRIEVLGRAASVADHLARYSRMDIALDSLPYNGTTTTCEALWMGVPVVTLAGDTHAGRVGVSLLNVVGLPELIAATDDEYVSIAARLASDHTRLAQMRASLRERVAASALCDGPAFCRRFETALRAQWVTRCAKSPRP